MAKFRTIKNSFLGGQIIPTCLGRTDLPQFPHSCAILQNAIPMLSGGVYRRPGTIATGASLDITHEHPPRLIPFIVNQREAYALMLGYNDSFGSPGYFQSFRMTGSVSSTGNIAQTGTHPYNIAKVGNYVANGTEEDEVFQVQFAQSADTMWLFHPNHKPQIIRRTAQDTFTLYDFDKDSTGTLLTGQTLVNTYPYLNQNATGLTLTPSAVSGNITLTASAALFNSNHVGSIFLIDHGTGVVGAAQVTSYVSSTVVNATVLVNFSAITAKTTWWESAWSNYRGWPRCGAIFQERLVAGGTYHQPDTLWHTATANYFQWSVLGTTNPGATILNTGTFQLTSADTVSGSQITVASGVIDFPDDSSQGDGRTTGPTGSQPFRITLAQNQTDQIQYISPDKELFVGTIGREWVIAPQNGSYDVGNSNAQIQSNYGNDWLPAVRIGYELIFAMRSRDEVRAYQYNYIDASFFGEPVQLLFDQYPQPEPYPSWEAGRKKIRQMEWDVTRQTLWCLDTAGNFYGMTRDRKLQVTAWHTHQFGGYNASQGNGTVGVGVNRLIDPAYAACDGSVISMAVTPNPVLGLNDVWLVVKRTISGTVNWQVETMVGKGTLATSAYISNYSMGEPTQVDGAVIIAQAAGSSSTAINPGNQLNGYTLTGTYYGVNGMFAISTTGAVAGGAATLQTPLPPDFNVQGSVQVMGLPYTTIVKPVRIEAGSVIGTAQFAIKKISKIYVRLFKTLMCKAGSAPGGEDESAIEIVQWAPGALMGQSPDLFTGDKRVIFGATYDRDGYIYVVQDQPFPWCLTSLGYEGEEFD